MMPEPIDQDDLLGMLPSEILSMVNTATERMRIAESKADDFKQAWDQDVMQFRADMEAKNAALARAEQALAEERKWKAWAETVEGLLVHRQTVHDIDLQCEDCQTIIAIFESMEPLAAASRRAGRGGVSDGQPR